MPSKLILDPKEPGIKDVISGLTSGQKITLDDVELTVDRNEPEVFEATVDSISVTSEATEKAEPPEAEEMPSDEIPPASNYGNPGKFDMGR